jgi:hypothetical protein
MLSLLEIIGLIATLVPICAACFVLCLAHLKIYSLLNLALISLAFVLLVTLWMRLKSFVISQNRGTWIFVAFVSLLLGAVGFAIKTSNTYLGGWDTGAYVNIASEMSRSGKLIVTDPLLADCSPREREAFMHKREPPRQNWHVGYQILNAEKGLLIPDFYHLYPSWLAFWHSLLGFQGIWIGHGVLALLSVFIFILMGESVLGKVPSLLAAVLLCLCPIQAYVMKTTMAELFTQFALISGVWAISRMIKNPGARWEFAITAGISWMAALLAHATAMLPVGTGLVCLCGFAIAERHAAKWKEVLIIVTFVGIGFLWNWFHSEELTLFVLKLATMNKTWLLGGVVLLCSVHSMLMRVRFLPFILISIGLIAGCYIRPKYFPGVEAMNLPVFIDLLGWAGVFGILAFMFGKSGRDWPHDARMLVFMVFVITGVLLINKRASPFYLWASRRWVEFSLPCAFLLAAGGLDRIWKGMEGLGPRFKGVGLIVGFSIALCWGCELWPRMKLIYETQEYKNVPVMFDKLAQKLGDADYIFSDRWDIPTVLRYSYGLPAWGLSESASGRAIADANFAIALMRKLVTHGAHVYWIGKWFADPVLRLTEVMQFKADGQVVELRSDRLPAKVRTDPLQASVYEISTNGGAFMTRVDIGSSSTGIIRGFGSVKYGQTRARVIFDYRRIKQNDAAFYVPVCAGKWCIRMAQVEDGGKKADVVIRISGKTVETFQVDEEWSDYYFIMPALPSSIAICEIFVKEGPTQSRESVGVDFVAFAGAREQGRKQENKRYVNPH